MRDNAAFLAGGAGYLASVMFFHAHLDQEVLIALLTAILVPRHTATSFARLGVQRNKRKGYLVSPNLQPVFMTLNDKRTGTGELGEWRSDGDSHARRHG
jgi:hypothetical protein